MRRFAGLSALLVAEMGALAVLIRLGRSPAFAIPLDRLGWWLQATPPGDVLAALARLAGLAVATLSAAHGARPSPAEVIPYWHALIALNRSRLRSGDPNLIYAGEVLLLPEL